MLTRIKICIILGIILLFLVRKLQCKNISIGLGYARTNSLKSANLCVVGYRLEKVYMYGVFKTFGDILKGRVASSKTSKY